MYEERVYRNLTLKTNLLSYTVMEGESDLQIYSKVNLEDIARSQLAKYRREILHYIHSDVNFQRSLVPVAIQDKAPEIVNHMGRAAGAANVGPMAAVAGAISEYVGKELLKYTDEIIVENGGDIFIKTNVSRKVLIYAGRSPFSNEIALEISPEDTPLGICTSAGTVGHSLSFGKADAVVVISKDTLIADAVATAIGNIVTTPQDIHKGVAYAQNIKGVVGVVVIVQDHMGAWGNIKLVKP